MGDTNEEGNQAKVGNIGCFRVKLMIDCLLLKRSFFLMQRLFI